MGKNLSWKKAFEKSVTVNGKKLKLFDIAEFAKVNKGDLSRLPYSIRILLENQLRNADDNIIHEKDAINVLKWDAKDSKRPEIPHMPARVVMQDFTGVPAVVDLASMRDAMKKMGGDPNKINPLVETALVIDHSVQVDNFGTNKALMQNIDIEFIRNKERYKLLKWGQKSFDNFKVVPPGMGIIHQINLEYLAHVVMTKEEESDNGAKEVIAYPDTLVGTDSHTTMINGLGIMGWGVGGIEAEAVMLGQPIYMILPDVVGMKLTGNLREGVTATDLVLRVTEVLRQHGVVGKFVEYFGGGLEHLDLTARATLSNMAPEYGATMGFFPVDAETVRYLKKSNRSDKADLVESIMKSQGLYREDASEQPEYSSIVELDLNTVDSTLAGPKRPQDRVPLHELKQSFKKTLTAPVGPSGFGLSDLDLKKQVKVEGMDTSITHGSVAIAAITSCTNTSNPYVLVGAGLLAKRAREKGLMVKPFVKTSLAPGSQVVTEYLKNSGLLEDLEALKFNIVGYGCTTCIGNSGSLDQPVIDAIDKDDLVVSAVISGNRNFEGRVNPNVKANYLASPILVVAYAIAGNLNYDPEKDSLGEDKDGNPVFLKDIWPSDKEIHQIVEDTITPEMFEERYSTVFDGTKPWQDLNAPEGQLYEFDEKSTYIQNPPFFEEESFSRKDDIKDARCLVMVADSVTTDHISPAGAIPPEYPAGKYLLDNNIEKKMFNSYGSRRGNHEVMMRGTFANIRIKNLLVPGVEGSYTNYLPDNKKMYIYDAAMKYKDSNTPLVVLAGKEYGTGSSRDWAAKGTGLLGVKFVIAESYERIHRSNLVGMGVLPLQFKDGDSVNSLGLDGSEYFTVTGLDSLKSQGNISVEAKDKSGNTKAKFDTLVRLDTDVDVTYYYNGGILQTVLKNLAK
jgi:aconitate hydratase